VAKQILEEWDAVAPATVAYCCANACIWPLVMATSRSVAEGVDRILGTMST